MEDVNEVVEPTAVETPVQMEVGVRVLVRGSASFEAVDLNDLCENRDRVMRSATRSSRWFPNGSSSLISRHS